MLGTPQMPLPRLFSTLAKMDPGSKDFLPTLDLFLRSKEERELLAQLEGSTAVYAANILDMFMGILSAYLYPLEYHNRTLRLMRSLCGLWGVLPTFYALKGEVKLLDEHPFALASPPVEVFRGTLGGELVAVKTFKRCTSEDPSLSSKRSSKEAIIWKHLHHPNILPFIGVSFALRGTRPCLVSPWMPNGNICDFAAKNPHFNRFKLLVDVCVGLQYLHARDIVHCDLKGDNVLIDSDCRARLADFGLANFDRSRWLGVTSTSSDQGGTRFYMAPELFRCESGGTRSKGPLMRKEADIYALGMLIYEVLSGKRPFQDIPPELVKFRVSRGARPRRPSSEAIPDFIWEMLQACWSEDPTQRPTVEYVLAMCAVHAAEPFPRDVSASSGNNPLSIAMEARASWRTPVFPNNPLTIPHHPGHERPQPIHSTIFQPC